MENSVIIKSYKDGLAVYLNDRIDFETLIADVETKFREAARFFGEAKVALSLEGRALSPEEETQVVDAITHNSRLQILCLVGKDDEKEQFFIKAIAAARKHYPKPTEEGGKFYRGNLSGGQILETEGSIVIIGNVEAGCSVISTKDIVVLGVLYGNAYAGGDGEPDHFIAALEMAPQKCKIGDFKYKAKEQPKRFLGKRKYAPRIAAVINGKIQMQAITKESLDGLSV